MPSFKKNDRIAAPIDAPLELFSVVAGGNLQICFEGFARSRRSSVGRCAKAEEP